MDFLKNVRSFAASVAGAVLLNGCSIQNHDPVEQKREEILIAMNAILTEQGITYPPQTPCLAYIFQENKQNIGKVTSILYCGDAFPIITRTQEIKNSEGDFELELIISDVFTDETGTIDRHSGCISALIHKDNETREISNCKENKKETLVRKINT